MIENFRIESCNTNRIPNDELAFNFNFIFNLQLHVRFFPDKKNRADLSHSLVEDRRKID